ncbi:hypothetical protein BKK51_01425 [Rodentibacter trehalosifermentans]|uniref:Long-chain fatty acid transporter n=1 Tax=Rodentibacter trehalosifermentans TaxID=1908263 RepID=A0A1V3IWS9_9PAST|nr:outer membrane protein transport protein [Rodentibacter trehalosifermentans]OOF46757.1 hypothetical protein BKK51_01425 [Rodentibacter trehalosifermentans]
MKKFNHSLLAGIVLLTAGGANAAAFQLAEVSTSGLGRAYAGEAAIADNASVVATNPALMTLFKRPEISIGAIHIDPKIDVNGEIGAVSSYQKNIAPNENIPSIYAVYPINDRFSVGGGINVNYGLSTGYNEQYAFGFVGGKTELSAINFNASGAYKINDYISFGLGLNAVYAKAKIERHVGVLPDLLVSRIATREAQRLAKLAGLSEPTQAMIDAVNQRIRQGLNTAAPNLKATDRLTYLKGDDWGYGWNAGLAFNINENNRLGVAYRSQVKIKFKGDFSNDLPTTLLANQTIAMALGQANIVPTGGRSIDGTVELTLPGFLEVSGYHKMTDKFAMHYSYKYTQWSKVKELRAIGEGRTLFQKDENFRDSSRIALGATYDINDQWTVRTGIAYDESAADSVHSISIPDTDRTWYSVGATYRPSENWSIDAGYSYLKGSKKTFTESGVTFNTKATANLYGLNVNYRF